MELDCNAIALGLKALRKRLSGYVREGDTWEVPVRLQVESSKKWFLHWGDPGYDPDHRGYWGDACLASEITWECLVALAEDLAEQCKEDWASKTAGAES